MSHLIKAILWLVFALLMAFCCVVGISEQNWFALVAGIIVFVFDIVDASIEFSTWTRERGKKAAKKRRKTIIFEGIVAEFMFIL